MFYHHRPPGFFRTSLKDWESLFRIKTLWELKICILHGAFLTGRFCHNVSSASTFRVHATGLHCLYSVLLLQLWHLKLLEEAQLLLHVCSTLGVVLGWSYMPHQQTIKEASLWADTVSSSLELLLVSDQITPCLSGFLFRKLFLDTLLKLCQVV